MAEKTEVLALPMFKDAGKVSGAALAVDRKLSGMISGLLAGGDFKGGSDELLIQAVPASSKLGFKRVALCGLGDAGDFGAEPLRRIGSALAGALQGRSASVTFVADDLPLRDRNAESCAQALSEGAQLALYQFSEFKKAESPKLKRLAFLRSKGKLGALLRSGLRLADATSAGVNFARDLGNLPGNHGRPKTIASKARAMARRHGLSAKVLGPREMQELEMGSLLSVALGSPAPPQLIVLEHNRGKKKLPTVCLVGKGLTFDSGGISLKPAADMDKMRYDKCGGCVVIGTMRAAAEANLPLHIVGIVPASENMAGGNANKPGDVVTASNGKTIEILNTDAEGRLILADALVYAQRFKPAATIDLATLTGACMVALGTHCCGLMSPDDELAQALEKAGQESFERAWRLPLWDEYSEEMKGKTTDLKNLGGRYGGAITAGAFLKEFAGDGAWAHLDIAGVSWDDSSRPYNRGKGATGFGVRLLFQYLRNLAGGN